MRVLPAIDVSRGRVVRLLRGRRGTETVYGEDPVEVALQWQAKGAHELHVVDLDAAFGDGGNRPTLERLLGAVRIPVQVGGGVRKIDDFLWCVDCGASRVIFGTAAVERPPEVRRALELAAEKVVLGVDVRNGRVATRGWEVDSPRIPVDFAREWMREGVATFVYTDVRRDGSLEGPNVDAVARFASETGARVIASGGVGTLDDLRRLRAVESQGVDGVILGRALYEGAFTLEEALDTFSI